MKAHPSGSAVAILKRRVSEVRGEDRFKESRAALLCLGGSLGGHILQGRERCFNLEHRGLGQLMHALLVQHACFRQLEQHAITIGGRLRCVTLQADEAREHVELVDARNAFPRAEPFL